MPFLIAPDIFAPFPLGSTCPGSLLAYLAILQPDARAAARINTALGGVHRTVAPTTWPELEEVLASEAVDGCVLDADHPDRESALDCIRRIRAKHPHLAIVALADFGGNGLDLFRLGGIGIDGLILARSPEGGPGIRQVVERALVVARAGRVQRGLEDRYTASGRRAVAWAVEHATESPSVATFAAAMGLSPRALAGMLRSAGLPPPSRVLLWGRLLLASATLAEDGRTVEGTAFLLGYSTGNALARAMKRETQCTPAEVARQGGMSFLQDILFPGRPDRVQKRAGSRRLLYGAAVAACCISLYGAPPSTLATGGGVDAQAINRVLDAPPLDRVHFGVLVVDAASGRTLYARNADETFIPASNQKLLVGSAAMSLLGASYRFRTSLWSAAPLLGDTLQGDVVLVGTGDPSLSDPTWPDGESALAALADSLRSAGVEHVTDSLIVDASAWDSTTVPETWEASDLPHGYAATAGAFAIDDGALTVIARGGQKEGEPASLSWHPHGTPGFVSADVVTGPADSVTRVKASYLPESRHIQLTGYVRPRSLDTLSFALRDPVRQATAALTRILAERGVDVRGGWSVAWDPGTAVGSDCIAGAMPSCPGARPLATLESPALSDIVSDMLGASQNWIAEQLVRTLGATHGSAGSMAEGLHVVRTFATERIGIDSLDMSLHDGSGLSMHDLVTPRAIVHILRYMQNGPDSATFREALAEPGERKSTLERRLEDLRGRLFAKSGTLSGVNSLSGYLVTDSGHERIFAILSNGSSLPTDTVRDAIDDIVHILSR